MTLDFIDRRNDPDAWAAGLGISREAIDIYAASDSIDLHIEPFIWTRLFGYDLAKRHGHGPFGARFFYQVDFPRMLEAGMTGGVWSISTNPLRRRKNRTAMCLRNLQRLREKIEENSDHFTVVTDHAGYAKARAAGKHACWIGIQGGNALDTGSNDIDLIPDNLVTRITIVHLSTSTIGSTSSPLAGKSRETGLTDFGRDYVRQMNAARILVDLAHINKPGFWDALEVHDKSQPAVVTHTGVEALNPMWRNIDDKQIKAIADLGGVIGIIYQGSFLGESSLGGTAARIVDHMEHVIKVVGDDYVALGSDWDGLIATPRDMKTVLEIPILAQKMLDRGWSAQRIGKIFGGNYLRVMKAIRP